MTPLRRPEAMPLAVIFMVASIRLPERPQTPPKASQYYMLMFGAWLILYTEIDPIL